jgi:hypothetical protein
MTPRFELERPTTDLAGKADLGTESYRKSLPLLW